MHISFTNVSKTYGGVVALRDVTLSIESGASVALVGPNGSGKSTLVHGLVGMVRTEGIILLDGQNPQRDRNRITPQTAYVPQILPQFNFTVGEMISAIQLIRGLAPGQIERCADRLYLDLGPISKKPVKQLSGGMKQKLSLALAFAPKTRLLVLDEPTASLDSETRQRFYEMVDERPSDSTLVLSSHRPDEVRQFAKQVVVLENGRVQQYCPVKDFFKSRMGSLLEIEGRDHAAA